jgi:uncharacterized damage-inducible protein DinB
MAAKLDRRTELDSIKEWYRYNSYVRKKYLNALEKLPYEELTRDRGASFPSMLNIFVHALDAYQYWFMFKYPGVPIAGYELRLTATLERHKDPETIEEVREDEKMVDSFVLNFVEGLDEEKLGESFETSDGAGRWRFTVSQMLWHLVEEELQHRGELNALFWQMNIDPPVTDWLDRKIETGEIRKLA